MRCLALAWALLAALAGFVIISAAAGGQEPPPPPRASLPDIEDEVMCPVCGVTLNLATEAQQAERERAFIRRLINQGKTKDEIKDALVAEFGPRVLATPDTEGFDLAAWVVPGAGVLLATLGIATGLRRWRRQTAARAESERGSAEPPLDSTDEERLDADLARYDL